MCACYPVLVFVLYGSLFCGDTSAQSRQGGVFCSLTEIHMKTRRGIVSTKSAVTSLVIPTLHTHTHTHITLTVLSGHVGRGYVLHPRIDMNCHPKRIKYMQRSRTEHEGLQCDCSLAHTHTRTHTHITSCLSLNES